VYISFGDIGAGIIYHLLTS